MTLVTLFHATKNKGLSCAQACTVIIGTARIRRAKDLQGDCVETQWGLSLALRSLPAGLGCDDDLVGGERVQGVEEGLSGQPGPGRSAVEQLHKALDHAGVPLAADREGCHHGHALQDMDS